jgi:hypothetical protein
MLNGAETRMDIGGQKVMIRSFTQNPEMEDSFEIQNSTIPE